MYRRDWRLFLMEILESINKIEKYTENIKSLEDFLLDSKTVDAVIRNLEIIGEAAGKIPEEIRNKANNIQWRQIIGLRNRLIHGYFAIDIAIVWEILQKDMPELKKNLLEIFYSDIKILINS
jgi:uncharacterized protein with HEPN domain